MGTSKPPRTHPPASGPQKPNARARVRARAGAGALSAAVAVLALLLGALVLGAPQSANAATTSLCAEQTASVDGGGYIVQNNEYGLCRTMTCEYSSTDTSHLA